MFFAHPAFTPAPPAPPAHVVVQSRPKRLAALPMVAAAQGSPLAKLVQVRRKYEFGACQAIDDVAWQLGYRFVGDCARFPATRDALPLPFGERASAAAWLVGLAHQLPPGTTVRVDTRDGTVSVLSK